MLEANATIAELRADLAVKIGQTSELTCISLEHPRIMSQYTAPLRDMNFVLNELTGLAHVATLPGFEETGLETVEAILDEAAKFASQVLTPINAEGKRVN